MARPKPKAAGQPIIDVLHPNDTPPAENSKSVIITKRPLMRDPMMAASDSSNTADSDGNSPADQPPQAAVAAKPATVSHQLVITPPANSQAVPSTVSPSSAAQPISDVVMPEAAVPLPVISPEAAGPSALQADPGARLEPLNAEAAEAQAEDEAARRQAELAALVDSQKYFLPVDGVELQRARYFVALGAILILALATVWADIALDAGLITVNGLPHTNVFQQAKLPPAAPVSDVPATQTYTAPLSKLSLKAPADWKLDATKATPSQDSLVTGPTKSNTSIGHTEVMFASGPSSAPAPIAGLIDSVHYQKLTRTPGEATYLQEVVYHTDATHYGVIMAVVNDQSLQVGEQFPNVTPIFHTANAAVPCQLTAVTTRNNGFGTLAAVEKYQRLTTYQQARTVLLSLTSPKQ